MMSDFDSQLDDVCDRFEDEWRSGNRPSISEFMLHSDAGLRQALLENLIPVDIEYRLKLGDSVDARDYAELGQVALEIAESQLRTPETEGTAEMYQPQGGESQQVHPSDMPGGQIGRYRLIKEIGRGGMGTVWEAEQTSPVRRSVALKLIRTLPVPRYLSQSQRAEYQKRLDELSRRFESERQTQAVMDHPNIAKMLDAGTTDDNRAYFVMELIHGSPITYHCDAHLCTIRQRVELMIQACQAIQHAHQKGIIHRDIKPTNVLVTKREDQSIVKVIDFGLAKITGDADRLLGAALPSQSGMILGTYLYMSPEQAGANTKDIDTRSDVYSLGVLLFELLTGSTPIDSKLTNDPIRVLNAIREDDTPRPSERVGHLDESASAISHSRQSDIRKLSSMMRGDLDWIVLKAMAKDRNRRYSGPSQFADDLQRYLDGEAIDARPPSAVYRVRKTIRKHRIAVAIAALSLALVTIGFIATYSQLQRAIVAEQAAFENAEKEIAARKKVEAAESDLAKQLAETNRQLDRSRFEEGRTWLERARFAKEKGDHLTAIMQAGRAVGFRGYGRSEHASEGVAASYPILLGKPIESSPNLEKQRQKEASEVTDFIRTTLPTTLPIWSSPVVAHHRGKVTCVAYSQDGSQLASGSDDKSIKIWDLATGSLILTIENRSGVTSIAFCPDGRRIASGSESGIANLWDLKTGDEIGHLTGHNGSVTSVAFSLDGRRIATGSTDMRIKLWDAESFLELAHFIGHKGPVRSVAFSPDESKLASGSDDKSVKLWNVAAGVELPTSGEEAWLTSDAAIFLFNTCISELNGHVGAVHCVAFSPDGSRIASGSADNSVKLWDVSTGSELSTLNRHAYRVRSVAFSTDGFRLASGSDDNSIKLWDLESKQELATLYGHSADVLCVAFSPDNKRLASGSSDRRIKLWDLATNSEVSNSTGHSLDVTCVSVSPDGSRLASGSKDDSIKIWDVASGKELTTLTGHSGPVNCVAFSPDGSNLVSGSSDTKIKLWDVATGKEILSIQGHDRAVTEVSFNPEGNVFASGSYDGLVKLWETATGRPLVTCNGHSKEVTSVAFSPDGRRLASGSGDETIKIWDAQNGTELFELLQHSGVNCIAFSPDGGKIASGSNNRNIKLWSVASGKEISGFSGPANVEALAFSSNSMRLASGHIDGSINFWRVADGERILSFIGHAGSVADLTFSPDGRMLFSGSQDSTVKLWDVADDHREKLSLTGHTSYVACVAISPDGSRIASASWDGKIKLWDSKTGIELSTLAGHSTYVDAVSFSPDGTLLVSGALDGQIKLWDAVNGTEVRTCLGHTNNVKTVTFSPDGTRFASGAIDGTIKLWDTESGKEQLVLAGHSAGVYSLAFSPDGSQLASASDDESVRLWNVTLTSEPLILLRHGGRVSSVAFSPDGNQLISGSFDGTTILWDAATGEKLSHLDDKTAEVLSVAISPNGRCVASGSRDGTIKLCELSSEKEFTQFAAHSGPISSVIFSPDGTRLVSGSNDRTVKVWSLGHKYQIGHSFLSQEIQRNEANTSALVSFPPETTLTLPSANLFDRLRDGYFEFEGKDIQWPINSSLQTSREFVPIHDYDDLIGQLAVPELTTAQEMKLRIQLCASGKQWRALIQLCRNIRSSDLIDDADVRQEAMVQLAGLAKLQFEQPTPELPRLVSNELAFLLTELQPLDFDNPRLSVILAEVTPRLLAQLGDESELTPTIVEKLPTFAPLTWLEVVATRIADDADKPRENADKQDTEKSSQSIRKAFVRKSFGIHSGSIGLIRTLTRLCDTKSSEWGELSQKLLTHSNANSQDFIDVAYRASKEPTRSVVASELVQKMSTRFADEQRVARMAGWCHLNLKDAPKAKNAFERARTLVKPEEPQNADLLCGLAMAFWLTDDKENAIATYRQLIKVGLAQDQPFDWSLAKSICELEWTEAEKIPLEAIRAATVQAFPDLEAH